MPGERADVIDDQTFIRNLERHLDKPVAEGLASDSRLKDLPDWDSLKALLVVASLDWDYGVTISADEYAGAETIRDLYALVSQKIRR
jgi:acyl carrier protein